MENNSKEKVGLYMFAVNAICYLRLIVPIIAIIAIIKSLIK